MIQSNNDYNNQNIMMNNPNLYHNRYNNYSKISDNSDKKAEIFFNKELYHMEKVKQKDIQEKN